jgi:glutathione peroxidase-family protein
MQELYQKHASNGLEILAFPCNNFGKQEPGTNDEVLAFAQKKGATFPVFGKLECENGDITHPLYQYLRGSLDNGLYGQGLKWNFTKFLCNAEGVPIKRYSPAQSPMSFEADILELLK